MGDLHSIAYCGNLHSSSLGWDYFHNNLGLLNTDFSHYMESNSTPPFYSSPDSNISTGYLEDALFEFNSKRRRMLLFSSDQTDQYSTYNNSIWDSWNLNCNDDVSCDFKLGDLSHEYCVDIVASKSIDSVISEVGTNMKKLKAAEETNIDSSSSSQSKSSVNTKSMLKCMPDKEFPTCSYEGERNKKMIINRVVYPFAMVKPGGVEGDITLNDINRSILMPPTRSIKHPVGDFACQPLVSPNGPGLSGKEVITLTRIQTQGRGTITIIRTRG